MRSALLEYASGVSTTTYTLHYTCGSLYTLSADLVAGVVI